MNKRSYLKLMQWLKKYNINKISYSLFKQYKIDVIDYNILFKEIGNYIDFSLYHIDQALKENDNIFEKYKENIIFQYIYLILSPYKFNNGNEMINAFYSIHKFIIKEEYQKIDDFLAQLSENKVDMKDINRIVRKINKFINNREYILFIEGILNSKNELGNFYHSNIFQTQSVISSTLEMLFIHKGNVDLRNFLDNIKKIEIDEYSINLLIQKCNNSKLKFFEYMLDYYNNRFFYHGTNSKWLYKVKKYGLNGVRNFEYQTEISKAIKLFETHGIYNTFEGRCQIKENFNYYITDSCKSAIYYAHQSPEYFSRFCANGYCMRLLKNCDHQAFWRRDYDMCFNNVYELCKNAKLKQSEFLYIIDLFKKLWKKEVKKNQYPIIFVGQIKFLEKEINYFNKIRKNINNYSFKQLYDIFTNSKNVHNKRFSTINKEFLSIIKLPNLYDLYKIKSNDFPSKKYIVNNGKKYYPDIIVKNEYYKDIFFIVSNGNKVKKISNNIYLLPKKFDYIDNCVDNSFYKQDLKYLLLTNGIDITNTGEKYLSNGSLEFKNIYKYYLDMTIQLINQYEQTTNDETKIELFSCIANNVFYNFYIMNKTNKLPSAVDLGYNSILHYDYDIHNYWYRSNIENNITIDKLDIIMEKIKSILNEIVNVNKFLDKKGNFKVGHF